MPQIVPISREELDGVQQVQQADGDGIPSQNSWCNRNGYTALYSQCHCAVCGNLALSFICCTSEDESQFVRVCPRSPFLFFFFLSFAGGQRAARAGVSCFGLALGWKVINCNCSRSYFQSSDWRLPLVHRFSRLFEGKCGWTELFATSWGEAAGRSWARDKYMLV